MRDILAALLRSRGYTHDDAADPYDLNWFGPKIGVRPMLACVAYEVSCETPVAVAFWDSYEVSVAHAPRGVAVPA